VVLATSIEKQKAKLKLIKLVKDIQMYWGTGSSILLLAFLLGLDDRGVGLLLLGLSAVHALVLRLRLLLPLLARLDDASVHGLFGHLAGVLPLPFILLDLLHGSGIVGALVPQVEHAGELLLSGGAGVKVLLVHGLDLGGLSLGAGGAALGKDKVADILTVLVFVDITLIHGCTLRNPGLAEGGSVVFLLVLRLRVAFLLEAPFLVGVHRIAWCLSSLLELADWRPLRLLGLVQEHSSAFLALCGIKKIR